MSHFVEASGERIKLNIITLQAIASSQPMARHNDGGDLAAGIYPNTDKADEAQGLEAMLGFHPPPISSTAGIGHDAGCTSITISASQYGGYPQDGAFPPLASTPSLPVEPPPSGSTGTTPRFTSAGGSVSSSSDQVLVYVPIWSLSVAADQYSMTPIFLLRRRRMIGSWTVASTMTRMIYLFGGDLAGVWLRT